jgi:hypothetical protein
MPHSMPPAGQGHIIAATVKEDNEFSHSLAVQRTGGSRCSPSGRGP